MSSSYNIRTFQNTSLLPSPELISFESDDIQNQISLLDIDEYDSPPPAPDTNTTLTVGVGPYFPTEDHFNYDSGGNSTIITATTKGNATSHSTSTLDPRACTFLPHTPKPILISKSTKEKDNEEELNRLLFTLRSPSSSSDNRQVRRQKKVTISSPSSSSNSSKELRRRKRGGKANSTKSKPVFLFKKRNSSKKHTHTEANLVDYIGNTSSPCPSPLSDTPDLTSASTNTSFEFLEKTYDTEFNDQAILLSKPSELIGIFDYTGKAFPYPDLDENPSTQRNLKSNSIKEDNHFQLLTIDEDNNHNNIHNQTGLNSVSEEEKEKNEDHQVERYIDLIGLSDNRRSRQSNQENIIQGIDIDLDLDLVTSGTKSYQAEEGSKGSTFKDYKFGLESDSDDLDIIEGLIDIDNRSEPNYQLDKSWFENVDTNPNEFVYSQEINLKGFDKDRDLSYVDDLIPSTMSSSSLTTSSSDSSSSSTSFSSSSSSSNIQNVSPYNLLLSKPSPRVTVPLNLIYTTTPDVFQSEIIQAWKSTEPTTHSKEFISNLLTNLTKIINNTYGKSNTHQDQRFVVDVFGSVSWGGETGKSGDLDLVILDKAQVRGYEPHLWRQSPGTDSIRMDYSSNGRRSIPPAIAELPRCYHTYDLANCLRAAGMRDVQPIPSASTPIVKFKDPEGKMECDINVNDLGGWYNSSLILHYCLISPYLLRPMIYILKRWLSAQDLNDASGAKGPATMSSYCLTLMIIAYLQARGCLPNLQKDINVPQSSKASDTNDPDIIWVSWSKQQGVPAHIAFSKKEPEGWKSREPELTVSEAVRGFFSYFSQTSPLLSSNNQNHQEKARFDHKKQIISILQGGLSYRVLNLGQSKLEDEKQKNQLYLQGLSPQQVDSMMNILREERIRNESNMGKGDRGIQPRNWSERRLVVQDPFLWQKNCAGMMSRQGLDRFFACVDRAYNMLQTRGRSATIDELLYNPNPIQYRSPTPGRGRGFGGSPLSYRGGFNGRNLWNA